MKSDEIKCPCCGQRTVPTEKVRVDLDRNVLYFRGSEIALPTQLADLSFTLAAKMPEVVHHNTIVTRLWGLTEPQDARTQIGVQIYRLRRRLLAAGLGIANFKERGYAMVVLPTMLRTETIQPREPSHAQA